MADDDFNDDSDNSDDFNNAACHYDHSDNFFERSDSDDDFDNCDEAWFCTYDDEYRQKSKRFKSLRKKVHWEVEEERRKFLKQLYVLIDEWHFNRLPDLKKYFRREEMDWLLTQDLDKKSRFNSFPLVRFAIRCGYKDNPDAEQPTSTIRTTPLHRAAGRKYYRLVPMLFEIYDRYDVNYVDERGLTHFHVACLAGCNDVVKRFLELDRDPKRLVNEPDASGAHPPLHLALFRGHEEVTKQLLKYGADPNLANADGFTPLHAIARGKHDDAALAKLFFDINDVLDQPIEVDVRDTGNYTPLHKALARNHKKVAVALLRRGAEPNAALNCGQTPLHVICENDEADDEEKAVFVKTFLETCRELDRPVWIDAQGFMDWTPLQLAVSNLLPEVVDVLLDHFADLDNFAFPDEFYFAEGKYERYYGTVNWFTSYLRQSYGVLAVVECLEKRGYQLTRADASAIMNFFDEKKLMVGHYEKQGWYDDTSFARVAKEQSVRPGLTLYDLVRLSPEEAAKLLTHKDYYEFARATKNWLPTGWPTMTCALHLCETMSRGFFRRWALEPLQKLTRYKLPNLCCEEIIGELGNEDLFRMYLAAASPLDSVAKKAEMRISKYSFKYFSE